MIKQCVFGQMYVGIIGYKEKTEFDYNSRKVADKLCNILSNYAHDGNLIFQVKEEQCYIYISSEDDISIQRVINALKNAPTLKPYTTITENGSHSIAIRYDMEFYHQIMNKDRYE